MNEKFFDLKSEKQDRMINAALHLFAVNGYKHASTDDIIKEAGISKGLLFHYFGSKQGLYEFLLDYSVKYLLFEYERSIGEEKDYFLYHEKLEHAKRGVLRNYPYMYIFIKNAISERGIEVMEMDRDSLKKYSDTIEAYEDRLDMPKLKSGINIIQIERLIQFTVEGLTKEWLDNDGANVDKLYEEIKNYIDLMKKMSIGQ